MDKDEYLISGIQQIGIGTVNFRKTWNWMIRHFGAETKILEDDTVAERMLPYTGGVPQKRHACIAMNMQGGGGFEIWQYSERKPQPCSFEVGVGDIGIFCAKIYQLVKPNNQSSRYIQDLYGNWYQFVKLPEVYIPTGAQTGGVAGALIGVTDMAKSIDFYANILGYDSMISDETGVFADWAELPHGKERYRRVRLTHNEPRKGAFSEVFGKSYIELVQALDRQPKKIYEGRYWGDPGFIQLCFDVTNMQALGKFCAAKGYPFTVDSCPNGEQFDMGEASGHFTYIEDPDGTLIEFVETHRIPIVKKLNWYLDLNKRNREWPLPKYLFRILARVSKQKIVEEKK